MRYKSLHKLKVRISLADLFAVPITRAVRKVSVNVGLGRPYRRSSRLLRRDKTVNARIT
jgi:hypothetical protein